MAVAQYYGTGRRKTSVARVRLVPGQGKITVNKKELTEYFGRKTLELIIKQPLVLAGVTEQYDVIADVKGGGPSGQAGAIRKLVRLRSSRNVKTLSDKRHELQFVPFFVQKYGQ